MIVWIPSHVGIEKKRNGRQISQRSCKLLGRTYQTTRVYGPETKCRKNNNQWILGQGMETKRISQTAFTKKQLLWKHLCPLPYKTKPSSSITHQNWPHQNIPFAHNEQSRHPNLWHVQHQINHRSPYTLLPQILNGKEKLRDWHLSTEKSYRPQEDKTAAEIPPKYQPSSRLVNRSYGLCR